MTVNSTIQAVMHSPEYKAYYFFNGEEHSKSLVGSAGIMQPNFPQYTFGKGAHGHGWGIPLSWEHLDTVMYSPEHKAYYFFNGNEYSKALEGSAEVMQPNFPQYMYGATDTNGHGWGIPEYWDHVDAAMYSPEYQAYYFFNGEEYSKAPVNNATVVQPGYPKGIHGEWGVPEYWDHIDAVMYSPEYKAYYFFNGNEYSKALEGSAEVMQPGYPKEIHGEWGVPEYWGSETMSPAGDIQPSDTTGE